MINLLPPEYKQTMLFARRNRHLIKWSSVTAIGIVGIGIVVMAGHFYINQSKKVYATELERTKQTLATQKLEETQKRIEGISTSTKLALQVLSRQVLFSKLLQQVGSAMPPGAALQTLSIGKLEGGIDLQAVSVDYQTATQVQINLQDPANKIFEKADIISITCSDNPSEQSATNKQYPCQISIRALFAKNNPFVFSNNTAGGNQ